MQEKSNSTQEESKKSQRELHDALHKSEARYRELVEHANSIILHWDQHGHITFFNEFAQKFFEYTEKEIIGRHVLDTIVPECESTGRDLRPLMDDICNHPEKYEYNINENITKSGKRVWVAWTNKVFLDDDGNPVGALSIGSDITEQRRLENELKQAHKMQAIGQLAGGIAHDFNNLLQGILGYAQIITIENKGARAADNASKIIATAQTAADLTKQLLTFARKGQYQLVECDLHELIDEVISILKRTIDKKITIKKQLNADQSHILGDAAQLKSGLLNLALNAKDAMPDGGLLQFSTSNIHFDEQAVMIADFDINQGKYLCINVTDTGKGMDKVTQARIFEPFFTTKKKGKGTGMGLAAVYGTVHLHEGAIRCSSTPGFGSDMCMYLPVYMPQQLNKAESVNQNYPIRSVSMMLVDDEEIVRTYTKTLFEMKGHKINCFSEPDKAISFYHQYWQEIDLVLLDMIMPKMNGRELFIKLKAINPDIKAILSTGYSVDADVQDVLEDGILCCIQKPFTIEVFEKTISKYFNE